MWPVNDFSNVWPLKIIHGHSKTIVTCSTRRKEHAGRWNFALAPTEAQLSPIKGFRHFSALDMTSEVSGWPRTLSLYIFKYILFVSRRATHSFFFREALAQSGAKQHGGSYQPPPPPLCHGRMRNGLRRRGLTRVLLGYFYNAPHRGSIHSPLLTPKLLVRFSKFKGRLIALENLSMENKYWWPPGHRWRHRSGQTQNVWHFHLMPLLRKMPIINA